MARTVKATVATGPEGWGTPDDEGLLDVTIKTTRTRPARSYVVPMEKDVATALRSLGEFTLYLTDDGQVDLDPTILFALKTPPSGGQTDPQTPAEEPPPPDVPPEALKRVLRSLEEHDRGRTFDAPWDAMPRGKARLTGIACPDCDHELKDDGDRTIRAITGQRSTIGTKCTNPDCGYTGRRKL